MKREMQQEFASNNQFKDLTHITNGCKNLMESEYLQYLHLSYTSCLNLVLCLNETAILNTTGAIHQKVHMIVAKLPKLFFIHSNFQTLQYESVFSGLHNFCEHEKKWLVCCQENCTYQDQFMQLVGKNMYCVQLDIYI